VIQIDQAKIYSPQIRDLLTTIIVGRIKPENDERFTLQEHERIERVGIAVKQ
jgi:hypothetical protein